MKQLGNLAKALGPARCQSELLPHLSGTCLSARGVRYTLGLAELLTQAPELSHRACFCATRHASLAGTLLSHLAAQVDDEDEVLMHMARQLGDMLPYVGGAGKAGAVLQILQALASVEETVVREAAVAATNKVVAQLAPSQVGDLVVPMLEQLVKSDWFTPRVSAAAMFAKPYSLLVDEAAKAKLRELYSVLATDDTPMVKRAAARHLGDLAAVMEPQLVTDDLLVIYQSLCSDELDSVRQLAVDTATAFVQVLPVDVNDTQVLPVVEKTAADKSWRVRNAVAKAMPGLAQALGGEATSAHTLHIFVNLLGDTEAEVRASAAAGVADMAAVIGADEWCLKVAPALDALANDMALAVRMQIAGSAMAASQHLTSDQVSAHVLPVAERLLADESADVRAKVLAGAEHLMALLSGSDIAARLVQPLKALLSDLQWRVRQGVLLHAAHAATALGAPAFETHLLPAMINALDDDVFAVRQTCATALASVAAQLGPDWANAKLVPRLQEMYQAASAYLQRNTVLYAAAALVADRAVGQALSPQLLPMLTMASRDPVPNVRYVVAKMLDKVYANVDAGRAASELSPVLSKLAGDTDRDVQWYAQHALTKHTV